MRHAALAALACLALPTLAGCPDKRIARPYPEPGAAEVIAHIQGLKQRARTLRAETVSDAWIGNERVKLTVYILAAWGGKLRYMAMNPGGANMAADLASDGEVYCFVDTNANCGECGPATPENVGRLIQVVMEPDDVVAVMLGSTPLLADARAALRWDAGAGHEVLELERDDGYTQRVVLEGRGHRWDVLDSEVKGPDGKRVWLIRHRDYREVKTAGGQTLRLPGKSRFEQPGNDVLIIWKEQEIDVELPDDKFRFEPPAGLPPCGAK